MTRQNKLNLGQLLTFGGGLYAVVLVLNAVAQWNSLFLLGVPVFFSLALYGLTLQKEAEAEFRRSGDISSEAESTALLAVELPKESR